MSSFSKWVATALVLAVLVGAGCGNGDGGGEAVSFKKGGPPAPKECVDRWNADKAALAYGRHAYIPGHDSRAGRAFFMDEHRRDQNKTCVVVFAASESDREYGTVGWFSTETRNVTSGRLEHPWQLITLLPAQTQDQLLTLQRTGAEQANVALVESGEITPLD